VLSCCDEFVLALTSDENDDSRTRSGWHLVLEIALAGASAVSLYAKNYKDTLPQGKKKRRAARLRIIILGMEKDSVSGLVEITCPGG